MSTDAHTIEELYAGEVCPRNIGIATFLTMVCPGLGYMYVGKLVTGLTVNFMMILLLEAFIISQYHFKFFPLWPFLVLVLAWITFCLLAIIDVRETLATEGTEDYIIKPYNHWMLYGLAALFSFALPIFGSLKLTTDHLWLMVDAPHAGMYPTIMSGDIVLADRRGYIAPPKRGDIVAVSAHKNKPPVHMLRAVGLPGDVLRYEEHLLYMNGNPIEHAPYDGAQAIDGSMLAMVEHNRSERYLITMARGDKSKTSIPSTRLKKGEMYLLSDNRSQVPLHKRVRARMRDSRDFGPIGVSKVRGKPLYVLWSTDPVSGRIRWDRIGIRVQ